MIDYGGHTQPGPRPYNEDAYVIRDLSAWSSRLGGLLIFAMVSDGMGGHEAGDVASSEGIRAAELYVDGLVRAAEEGLLAIDPAAALIEIGRAANDAVLRAGAERGVQSMGATLVALFAAADTAWIGHVGDSRAYRLSHDGASQLTADHSAVGRLIAEGVLTEEQAQTHPQRNVIERALGFDDDRPIDVDTVPIEKRDVLLLCSDGVSTVLTGLDMRDIVYGAKNLQKAAGAVVAEALAAGGDDNATAVLWSAGFVSRGPGTLPGGRGGRRVMSAQRRQAKRHGRAQRASWVAAGVLVIAVLALFVFGGNLFGGGASGGAVGSLAARPTTGTATPTVDASVAATPSPTPTNEPNPSPPESGRVTEATGVPFRASASADATLLAKLKVDTELRLLSPTSRSSGQYTWVNVQVTSGPEKGSEGWVNVARTSWSAWPSFK